MNVNGPMVDLIERHTEGRGVILHGLEDALIGVAELPDGNSVTVYDQTKIIEILKESGLSEDQAQESFACNVNARLAGCDSPIFVIRP